MKLGSTDAMPTPGADIDLVQDGPTIDLDAPPHRPLDRPLHHGYPAAPLHSVSATQPSSSPARVLDSVASHRL